MATSETEAEAREFVEIVDWTIFQYSDHRKKPHPPWRWFRIQMTLLRSPQWLALTKPQRADFIAVLGAASETGNMIPLEKKWLRLRELSPRILQKLSKTGLVRSFSLPANHSRIKDLRRVFSGGIPASEADADKEIKTEGGVGANPDSNSTTRTLPQKSKQPDFEELVRTCVHAGVRGSNWMQITKIIEQTFGFTVSDSQLMQLDRQISDREKN